MTNKIEILPTHAPEDREAASARTLSSMLSMIPPVEMEMYAKELENAATDPRKAKSLAENHPVFTAFLILHGTDLMHAHRTKTVKKFGLFSSRPELPKAAAATKGALALRKALAGIRQPERGVAGERLSGADTNARLHELIVNGQPTCPVAGVTSFGSLPPDALLTLRYAAMAFSKTPEHMLNQYVRDTLLPVAKVKGNAYEHYRANDPAIVRSADAYNLLRGMSVKLSKAQDDGEFFRLIDKQEIKVGQDEWTAAETIRQRDANHTPVEKLFVKEYLPKH